MSIILWNTQDVVHNYTSLCQPDGGPKEDTLLYLDCYADSTISHNPPLIFNVEEDPGESYPLDPNTHTDIINLVVAASNRHKNTIPPAIPSQFGMNDESLQPCCNPPNCICNYPMSNGNAHTEL